MSPFSLFLSFPLSLPPSVTFLPSVFIPHIYRALHRYLPFISHATPHTFASATTHTSIFSVSVAYYLIPYPYLILIIKHVYSGHFLLDFSSPSSGLRHVPKSSKNCKHQWFCRPDLWLSPRVYEVLFEVLHQQYPMSILGYRLFLCDATMVWVGGPMHCPKL